jgi:O-antigen/teichoic acid export membrane protein
VLYKHSILYLGARSLPAIIGLAAIAVYTRLLEPDEYGKYAWTYAGVMFVNALMFSWLKLSIARFYSSYREDERTLLSYILTIYFVIVAVSLMLGVIGVFLLAEQEIRILVILGVAYFWAYGWYEITIEVERARLKPVKYGLIALSQALSALVISVVLIKYGLGAEGILAGLIIGTTLTLWYPARKYWRGIRLVKIDRRRMREFLYYGLPLSATFVLAYIINSSDRYLLLWYLDTESVGLYEVGYDVSKRSLMMLMLSINLAAFPIVVKELEEKGKDAARKKLSENFILLFGISLPAGTGFIILSSNISHMLLGELFADTAMKLIPVIVVAALLDGWRAFYFNQSFHLSKASGMLIWVFIVAAIINVILNLLLIPEYGIFGAAYATVAAYAVAIILSWYLGNKIFPLSTPSIADIVKIIFSTAIMGVIIRLISDYHGVGALIVQVIIGIAVYGSAILLLDVGGIRKVLYRSR